MKSTKQQSRKKNSIVVSLSLSVAILLNTSCASHNGKLPNWVTTPIQDTHLYIYGIGQGDTLGGANTSALKNAVTKLGVTVSGNYNQRMTYSDQEEHHSLTDSVNLIVNKTSVSAYQQVKTQTVDDIVYALVKIDKNALILDYKQSLSNANAGANLHIKNFDDISALVWLVQAKYIARSDSPTAAKRYSSILSTLDPFHDLSSEQSPWPKLNQMIEAETRQACLALSSKDAISDPFVDVLKNHLKEQNFNTGNTCPDNLLVSTTVTNSKYYGMFISRNELVMSLNKGSNKTIQLTSQSATGYEQSTQSNLLQLTEKLHEDFLWETLGFIKLSNK
jgi:hypothetical protein